jgi:hypothetical protein
MAEPNDDIAIGKFDILTTYTLAKALLDGLDEAKVRGMVAAIMGAQARLGIRRSHEDDHDDEERKKATEKQKKTTITAESFDRDVADKMGGFYSKAFLPVMRNLVDAALTYPAVKVAVGIPSVWGAKISGQQFQVRAAEALEKQTRG